MKNETKIRINRFSILGILSVCTVAMSPFIWSTPVFGQDIRAQLSIYEDKLQEKELTIRNIRRYIFDLERQIPKNLRGSEMHRTIELLKKELNDQQSDLAARYEQEIIQLQETISQLNGQIQQVKTENSNIKSKSIQDNQSIMQEYEQKLTLRTAELEKTNEQLTRSIAQQTSLDERNKALAQEIEAKKKDYEDLQKKYDSIAKKRRKQIKTAQEPLEEKIVELEKIIEDVRRQALEDGQYFAEEKEKLQTKLEADFQALTNQLNEKEDEFKKQLKEANRLKDLVENKKVDLQNKDEEIASLKQDIEGIRIKLQNNVDEYEKQLADKDLKFDQKEKKWAREREEFKRLASDSKKAIEDYGKKDQKIAALQKQINDAQDLLKTKSAEHEEQLKAVNDQLLEAENRLASRRNESDSLVKENNRLSADVLKKEEQIVSLKNEVKDKEGPLLRQIEDYKKQIDNDTSYKEHFENEMAKYQKQIKDQSEELNVYKKLIQQKDIEITEISADLEKLKESLVTNSAEDNDALREKIAKLRDEVSNFDTKFKEERVRVQKEAQREIGDLNSQLSATKIDLEYRQSQIDKLSEENMALTKQLKVVEGVNIDLNQQVRRIDASQQNETEMATQLSKLKNENVELAERMQILLKENAQNEQKIAEMTTKLETLDNVTVIEEELIEARELLDGFQDDVDAKTNEIASLSSENRDLRLKLKDYIKQSKEFKKQLLTLQESQVKMEPQESAEDLNRQLDALKTALSKARQGIAQKDAIIDDLKLKMDTINHDYQLLSTELNDKIQQIGFIEQEKRKSKKKYSEEDLDRMKTPLIVEIDSLKNRVEELESQLLETWDTAEGMLIELKNHPKIRKLNNEIPDEQTSQFP